MHVPARTGERGFTMVELLVVILIIGILAMIALPAFIGQRMKGEDTDAQTTVRTVATALATYHTDHNTYDATRAELVAIEPAVGAASLQLDVVGTDDAYTITERSGSDTEFTLRRESDGEIRRSCTIPGRGLCNDVGEW
jgi:prepilin-type N-terminal cleavage/methylation domain-containing protein